MHLKRHSGKSHALIEAAHDTSAGWEYLKNEDGMEKIAVHVS